MSDILRRTYAPLFDMEIRTGGDGRSVYGIAVPFDTPTTIVEGRQRFSETFRFGAFADTIAERGDRVKFLAMHNRQAMPLGRALSLREDPAGLIGEFRVSKTQQGDEALELIRDGVLDSFSIGFVPKDDNWSDDRSMVERRAVKLLEVSAVSFPAYEGAQIAGVRDADPDPQTTGLPQTTGAPDQRDETINSRRVAQLRRLQLEVIKHESH